MLQQPLLFLLLSLLKFQTLVSSQISIDPQMPTEQQLMDERKHAEALKNDPLRSIATDMPDGLSINANKLRQPSSLRGTENMPDGSDIQNLIQKTPGYHEANTKLSVEFSADTNTMPVNEKDDLEKPVLYVSGGQSMLVSDQADPMRINVQ
jgi:hypothetical protein